MVRTAEQRAHPGTTPPSAVVDCAGSRPRTRPCPRRGTPRTHRVRTRSAARGDRRRSRHRRDPEVFLRDWLAGTTHLDAALLHTPTLAEELRGIAEGAPSRSSRSWRSTSWTRCGRPSRTASGIRGPSSDHPLHGCSAVAVRSGANEPPLLAQTMDLGPSSEGTQAVLRIREDDGREVLVVTRAGMIGLMGANDAGLGVCVNALTLLRHDAHGLPVAFVMRGMLERRSLAEAADVRRRGSARVRAGLPPGLARRTRELRVFGPRCGRRPLRRRGLRAYEPSPGDAWTSRRE